MASPGRNSTIDTWVNIIKGVLSNYDKNLEAYKAQKQFFAHADMLDELLQQYDVSESNLRNVFRRFKKHFENELSLGTPAITYESFARGINSLLPAGADMDEETAQKVCILVDEDKDSLISYRDFRDAVIKIKMSLLLDDTYKLQDLMQEDDEEPDENQCTANKRKVGLFPRQLQPVTVEHPEKSNIGLVQCSWNYVLWDFPPTVGNMENRLEWERTFYHMDYTSPIYGDLGYSRDSQSKAQGGVLHWVSLFKPWNLRTILRLAVKYQLHPLAIEDLNHLDLEKPKVDHFPGEYTFIVLPALRLEDATHKLLMNAKDKLEGLVENSSNASQNQHSDHDGMNSAFHNFTTKSLYSCCCSLFNNWISCKKSGGQNSLFGDAYEGPTYQHANEGNVKSENNPLVQRAKYIVRIARTQIKVETTNMGIFVQQPPKSSVIITAHNKWQLMDAFYFPDDEVAAKAYQRRSPNTQDGSHSKVTLLKSMAQSSSSFQIRVDDTEEEEDISKQAFLHPDKFVNGAQGGWKHSLASTPILLRSNCERLSSAATRSSTQTPDQRSPTHESYLKPTAEQQLPQVNQHTSSNASDVGQNSTTANVGKSMNGIRHDGKENNDPSVFSAATQHNATRGRKETGNNSVPDLSGQRKAWNSLKQVMRGTLFSGDILRNLKSRRSRLRQYSESRWMLYEIVDEVVDQLAPIREAYRMKLAALQYLLHLRGANFGKQERREIGRCKTELQNVLRAVKPLVTVVRHLRENEVHHDHTKSSSSEENSKTFASNSEIRTSKSMPDKSEDYDTDSSHSAHTPKSSSTQNVYQAPCPTVSDQTQDFSSKVGDEQASGMELHIFYDDVLEHLYSALSELEDRAKECEGMINEFRDYRDTRMNDVLYILTLTTTLFLPAQFLTGLFGMNFSFGEAQSDFQDPMLAWDFGYLTFWVLLVAIESAVIWIGWKLGYLQIR